MIPYFLLLLIPWLFSFCAIRKNGKKRSLCIGNSDYIKQNNLAVTVFFILLFVLLAIRDMSVGRDLVAYHRHFFRYSSQPLNSIKLFELESLFKVLYWVIGRVASNFQFYITVISLLTIIPIAALYNEEKQYGYLKIVLFVNMTTFVMIFSGIRQSLAMALGVIAYHFVRKKNWIAFLLTVVIALGIHHSAFMILFMYPLYHISFKRKHLWFIIPAVGAAFAFNRRIFMAVNVILSNFSDEYTTEISVTGATTTLILFLLFAVFSYVIPDEAKLDRETVGLRNFMVFAVIMQCFSSLHPLAMRLNYYFILFIPVLIVKVLKKPAPAMGQVAKFSALILSIFFTVYFIYTIYMGCQTENAALLNTCPYLPFWAS